MRQGVPPELARAIRSASQQYGVPDDVLTGIWRIESGSSFPNPYVNSSGYGGLFGTHNWNASTQEQADTAAQILASNIQSHGGDLSAALYSYSGHGYTSVPGQTTFGTVTGASPQAGPSVQAPPRPGTPASAQDVGLFSSVEGGLSGAWNFLSGGLGSGFGDVKDVLAAFLFLFQPKNWVRAFEIIAGTVFMLGGLYWIAKDEGAPDIPVRSLLKRSPAGAAASSAVPKSATGRSKTSQTESQHAASRARGEEGVQRVYRQ